MRAMHFLHKQLNPRLKAYTRHLLERADTKLKNLVSARSIRINSELIVLEIRK